MSSPVGLHSEGILSYGDLSVVNCYPTSGNHLTYYTVLQGWVNVDTTGQEEASSSHNKRYT